MHFISHIALATLTLAKCYNFFCPLSFAFQYCNVFTKGYLDKTKHGAVILIFVSMFRLKPLALFGRVKRNVLLNASVTNTVRQTTASSMSARIFASFPSQSLNIKLIIIRSYFTLDTQQATITSCLCVSAKSSLPCFSVVHCVISVQLFSKIATQIFKNRNKNCFDFQID